MKSVLIQPKTSRATIENWRGWVWLAQMTSIHKVKYRTTIDKGCVSQKPQNTQVTEIIVSDLCIFVSGFLTWTLTQIVPVLFLQDWVSCCFGTISQNTDLHYPNHLARKQSDCAVTQWLPIQKRWHTVADKKCLEFKIEICSLQWSWQQYWFYDIFTLCK